MLANGKILDSLKRYSPQLADEILASGKFVKVPEATEVISSGKYLSSVPLLVSGLVRVYTSNEEKELLLYYIQADETCIMSFMAAIRNEPGKVTAITEEPSEILLIPVEKVQEWLQTYPMFNALFYQQFNIRYADMLGTINQLLFDRFDVRLLAYLKERIKLTGQNPLKISHRQIAQDMASAREVVSRVMKKLESDGKLVQHAHSIEVLPGD